MDWTHFERREGRGKLCIMLLDDIMADESYEMIKCRVLDRESWRNSMSRTCFRAEHKKRRKSDTEIDTFFKSLYNYLVLPISSFTETPLNDVILASFLNPQFFMGSVEFVKFCILNKILL